MSIDTQALAENSTPPAPYYRLGGADAIKEVVERFYARVLGHPDLAPYFVHLDLEGIAQVKRHQVILISHVLGGPTTYDVGALGTTHEPLNISPVDYRRTTHLLIGTLWEVNVPEDIIFGVSELLAGLQPVIAPAAGAAE